MIINNDKYNWVKYFIDKINGTKYNGGLLYLKKICFYEEVIYVSNSPIYKSCCIKHNEKYYEIYIQLKIVTDYELEKYPERKTLKEHYKDKYVTKKDLLKTLAHEVAHVITKNDENDSINANSKLRIIEQDIENIFMKYYNSSKYT